MQVAGCVTNIKLYVSANLYRKCLCFNHFKYIALCLTWGRREIHTKCLQESQQQRDQLEELGINHVNSVKKQYCRVEHSEGFLLVTDPTTVNFSVPCVLFLLKDNKMCAVLNRPVLNFGNI